MTIGVVIPALNEASRIGQAITSASRAGADQIVVADGGSTDATVAIAREHGADVLVGPPFRARQMNEGALSCRTDVLIFLHADSELPIDACRAVASAIESGFHFGGFRIEFIEPSWRLRAVALMINARTRLTRCPWGDQAQFVTRERFASSGGFREIPLMEDYELARRMRALGPTALLDPKVRTSGRRFLERGILRTTALNWRIIAGFHRGVDPAILAARYRRTSSK